MLTVFLVIIFLSVELATMNTAAINPRMCLACWVYITHFTHFHSYEKQVRITSV